MVAYQAFTPAGTHKRPADGDDAELRYLSGPTSKRSRRQSYPASGSRASDSESEASSTDIQKLKDSNGRWRSHAKSYLEDIDRISGENDRLRTKYKELKSERDGLKRELEEQRAKAKITKQEIIEEIKRVVASRAEERS